MGVETNVPLGASWVTQPQPKHTRPRPDLLPTKLDISSELIFQAYDESVQNAKHIIEKGL